MAPGQHTDIKSRVAANIGLAMRERGIGPAELARETGGHERAVRRWRDGGVTPSQNNLAALALALGKDVEWFYVNPAEKAAA